MSLVAIKGEHFVSDIFCSIFVQPVAAHSNEIIYYQIKTIIRFLFHPQQLAQLELLCQQLYESHEPGVRLQAEKALVGFTESQESLPQCQMVLERSQVQLSTHCTSLLQYLTHIHESKEQ